MNISEKINSLRRLMENSDLDAYVINGNDPHLSEYTPARWKTREWISGFTGSYGRIVVTLGKAVLWTDSRYFIQAEDELKGSGISLFKDRQPDTIAYEDWLFSELRENDRVGIDGCSISISEEKKLKEKLGAKGIVLLKEKDLVDEIWADRPKIPLGLAFDYSLQYAGKGRAEKINQIRQTLREKLVSATIVCMLDDLAWTFNIRGNDIDYTPLVTGFGYIDQEKAILFIDEKKIPESLKVIFNSDNIEIRTYASFFPFLKEIRSKSILIDPDRTNSLIKEAIPNEVTIIESPSIPMLLKCIKNTTEINGMREAHRKDGIAMINFLYWISSSIDQQEISELTICDKLKEFRSEQKNFIEESFHPIAGYAEHGAIVHYHVNSETNSILKADGLLLVDSGGQYLEGTTDITRTISLGKPTRQQKNDFTLVLKGMIQLSKAIFPSYARGSSLDILGRKALWENSLDYGHGTGHGVGHFLCVHEAPVSIRQDSNPYYLNEGNILSNEPGLYKEGGYGIRIENLMLCKRYGKNNSIDFLTFETLTLCPIDRKLILRDLLTSDEIEWINNYHQRIINELGSYLIAPVLEWLKNQCTAV